MTTISIILIIIALVVVALSIYSLSKIKKQIFAARQQLQAEEEHLDAIRYEEKERDRDLEIVRDICDQYKKQVTHLEERKNELNADIEGQVTNVERLKASFELTQQEFEKKYLAEQQSWIKARENEYLKMQEDFSNQFKEENRRKLDAAKELTLTLDELKSAVAAATEVAKRHAEEENFYQFHSLQLGPNAINDVKRLEDLVPQVSKEAGEAIAKVIWKVYYEKPYTDLVGRVVGSQRKTGIYRITNIQTKMCYVGQAVDIADRWRQHIKRALGAEPRTQNKLYPAMYSTGIENWTFEIIELCSQDKLTAREDYWQDFYKAKEYGYSIK